MERLIDYDPVTKTRTVFEASPDGEEFRVTDIQDVEDIIEQNKREYAAVDERARYGDLARVARIPDVVVADLQRRGILDPDGEVKDEARFLKWLDDPANLHFRTRPGSLSR